MIFFVFLAYRYLYTQDSPALSGTRQTHLQATPTSECPITYCRFLISMPAFAMLVQNVWRNTWGVIWGNGLSGCSFLYFFIAQRISFSICNATFGLSSLSNKRKLPYPSVSYCVFFSPDGTDYPFCFHYHTVYFLPLNRSYSVISS